MKWIITTQLPDSQPPQQGASDLISGQIGLCVYRFYLHIIPSHINIIFFNQTPSLTEMRDCKLHCFTSDEYFGDLQESHEPSTKVTISKSLSHIHHPIP